MAEQAEQVEQSSGAWTRTRTTQLQRLVRCQLRYAGWLPYRVMGYYLERFHDTGPDPVSVSEDFLRIDSSAALTRFAVRPAAMLASAQPSILR